MDFEKLGLSEDQIKAVKDEISKLEADKSAIANNSAKLLEEKKAIEDKLKQYDGIDLDAIKKQAEAADDEKVKALLKAGHFDQVLELTLEKERGKFGKQLSEAEKKAQEAAAAAQKLKSALVSTVRDGGIASAFAKEQAEAAMLKPVKVLASGTVMVDGEPKPIVEVATDGTSTFRHSETGEVLDVKDYAGWLKHLAENEKLPLFAGAKGSGSQGSGNGSVTVGNFGGTREERKAAIAQKFKLPKG